MITVIPAYGRDYQDASAVRKAWEAGKDFLISDIGNPWHGSYINKDDDIDMPVWVRHHNLLHITCVRP